MTYDEAAKWFEDYPPLAIWDEKDGGYDEVPHEAIHLAANTLRAIADAQSDAGKGLEQAFEHWMDNPPPHFHDMEVAVVALQEQNNWAPLKRVCFRDGFDAGHAQGVAAGIAAQEAKVVKLTDALQSLRKDAYIGATTGVVGCGEMIATIDAALREAGQ